MQTQIKVRGYLWFAVGRVVGNVQLLGARGITSRLDLGQNARNEK